MKFSTYVLASSIACVAVIVHDYLKFHQFYLTCVHMVHYNPSLFVLYNTCFMIIVGLAKIIQRIAFNNLRPMEVEHIYEKSWYTITETCLTMTIFRNEFNLKFVVLFTCLLICKVYHWIIQDRIEYVEQTPSIRRLFHIRLGTIMMLLAIIDSWFAVYYLRKVIKLGPSMMIFFGFEYLALAVMINSMIIRYIDSIR
jgi:hypothetical protein